MSVQDRRDFYERQTKGDLVAAAVSMENALVQGVDLRGSGVLTQEEAEQKVADWVNLLPEGAAYRGTLTAFYMDAEGELHLVCVGYHDLIEVSK